MIHADTINLAASLVQIIWGTAAFLVFWVGVIVTMVKTSQKREVKLELLIAKVETIDKRQEKEFGGNGGGFRERLNSMDKKLDSQDKIHDDIIERQDETAQNVANLTGRFDEYISSIRFRLK